MAILKGEYDKFPGVSGCINTNWAGIEEGGKLNPFWLCPSISLTVSLGLWGTKAVEVVLLRIFKV
jgi:hypothetical protein